MPQFSLVKLHIDTRPRNFAFFGVLVFPKEGRDSILLFGGGQAENPTRVTYLFDEHKKEVCKCNIYAGDVDKFMVSYLYQDEDGPDVLAFGQTRMHIFHKAQRKFTGARCYDFEYFSEGQAPNLSENPEEDDRDENNKKTVDQILSEAGKIDDLLI